MYRSGAPEGRRRVKRLGMGKWYPVPVPNLPNWVHFRYRYLSVLPSSTGIVVPVPIFGDFRYTSTGSVLVGTELIPRSGGTGWWSQSRWNRWSGGLGEWIRAIWDSATIEDENNEEVIKAKVEGHNVTVSEETIRTVLQFGDKPEDPHIISVRCYQGCLLRVKCTGDVLVAQLNKTHLLLQYKYFLHVLIHCLGTRKIGYDMARDTLL
ncbi:hypothetical protein Hanom_Chr07g00671101 [Helianthus anomalus]